MGSGARTTTGRRWSSWLLLGYWNEILVKSAEEIGRRRTHDLGVIRSSGVPYRYVTGSEPDPAYRGWLKSAVPKLTVTVLPDGGHFPQTIGAASPASVTAP